MAGIGLDASIVHEINPAIKRHGGILAFWVSGLKHLLRWDLPVFTLELNGRQFTGTFAAIANAPLYGGGVIMAPDARLDDEFLRVCLFETKHGVGYLPYLPLAFSGRHVKMPGVVYVKAQRARAYADGEVQVQVDGELAGTLPMDFEIVPAAVSVLVA
jgi:diacylglycerol kinase family enzyme